MIEPRLATHMRVEALKRVSASMGCFATIVGRGDPTSGALVILGAERGRIRVMLEAMPSLDGPAKWQPIWPEDSEKYEQSDEIQAYLDRRKGRDPDLWIVELDVAQKPQLDEILLQVGLT